MTSGTARSPTSSTSTCSPSFAAPDDPRRPGGKRLTHEDLSGRIIEDELGPLIRGLRRAPAAVPERAAFASDEHVDPAWVAYLISKPALVDDSMPRWLRWLQPLLSGVFTVDNLDYVRRDSYLTGVATGPVDVERLRRYAFVSSRGLTLYEPGLGALEIFLTARRFMYQQVYFHRTVRAIDLDLAAVFGPSVIALVGDRSPVEDLRAYADLDEYALLHQAARWARGESVSADPRPGDGTATSAIADAWRAILLRQPTWRADREIRAEYEAGAGRTTASPRSVRRNRAAPRSTSRRWMPGRPAPTRIGCWHSRRATGRRCRCRTRSPRSRRTGSSRAATDGSARPPTRPAGRLTPYGVVSEGTSLAFFAFLRSGRTSSGSMRAMPGEAASSAWRPRRRSRSCRSPAG